MPQTDELRPLEEIRSAVQRIERALVGDLSTGTPGLLERTRKAEERLERHSKRIHNLEETRRWTVRTVADRLIGAVISATVGAVAAVFALGRPHP